MSGKKSHCDDCAHLDAWLDYVYDGEMCWQYECTVSEDGRCRPATCNRFKHKCNWFKPKKVEQ